MTDPIDPNDGLRQDLNDYLSRYETYNPATVSAASEEHVVVSRRRRILRGGIGFVAVALSALLAASLTVLRPAAPQTAGQPTPTASVAALDVTSLQLSGAIKGQLAVQSVVCTAGLDYGIQMNVIGDVNGHLWMTLAGDPGKPHLFLITRSTTGSPIFNSQKFLPNGTVDQTPLKGVANFAANKGATIDTDVPSYDGKTLHIAGHIVCPPAYATTTSVAFDDSSGMGMKGFNGAMDVTSVACVADTAATPGHITVRGKVNGVAWILTTTGRAGHPTAVTLVSGSSTVENDYHDVENVGTFVVNYDPERGVTLNEDLAIAGGLPTDIPGPASFVIQGQVACPAAATPSVEATPVATPDATPQPTPTEAPATPQTITPEATPVSDPSPSA